MTISIFSRGKQYISASQAGDAVGYTSDYVGQLCRAGRIPGKLIGRTWYVDLESLRTHRSTRQLGKPKVQKEVSVESRQEIIELVDAESNAHTRVTNGRSSRTHFTYHTDERALLPELKKKRKSFLGSGSLVPRPKTQASLTKFSLAAMPAIALVITGIVTLGNSSSDFQKANMERVMHAASSVISEAAIYSAGLANEGWEGLRSDALGESREGGMMQNAIASGLSREEIRSILRGKEPIQRPENSGFTGSEQSTSTVELPQENPFGMPK